MNAYLRANLLLLVLTIVITAIAYPAVLWAIGQTIFHDKAEGSLIRNSQGQVVGSRLIAQPFTEARDFHPRPSAVGYNSAATGGSNWGANNPKLRKRVLSLLGGLLKYRDGRPVGPDIQNWVRQSLAKDSAVLTDWQKQSPGIAEWWVNADNANLEFVSKWAEAHPSELAVWKQAAGEGAEPTPVDLATLYFDRYANGQTTDWPSTNGSDLEVAFFEVWWNAHQDSDVEPVPADLVMASGCGLDPDITVQAARYQLNRVAAAWAADQARDVAAVQTQIETIIAEHSRAALGGIAGPPLVNVLELNLAVRDAMTSASAATN